MPILTYDEEEAYAVPSPDPVKTPTEPLSTTPVYESKEQQLPLIVDVEGEPWDVEYYNQLLTSGERPKPFDPGLDPTLQQYVYIKGFRLSVTADLSSSNDADTGTTTVSGAGVIYPNTIIPHVGDMFIGKVEAGFYGLFSIKTVNRTTFYKKAAYEVEYTLYDQLDAVLKQKLTDKVIENKFFDPHRLLAGEHPLISYEKANNEVYYKQSIGHLIDQLYQMFYHRESKTFVVEEADGGKYYDPWAIAFFNTVTDRAATEAYSMPEEYHVGVDKPLEKPTLWRAILKADPTGLSYLYPRIFQRKMAGELSVVYIRKSIVHTRIDYVIMPDKWTPSSFTAQEVPYVLSHAFYDDVLTSQTPLEKAVMQLIKRERVTDATINLLLADRKVKTGLALFYHLILLTGLLTVRLHEG